MEYVYLHQAEDNLFVSLYEVKLSLQEIYYTKFWQYNNKYFLSRVKQSWFKKIQFAKGDRVDNAKEEMNDVVHCLIKINI